MRQAVDEMRVVSECEAIQVTCVDVRALIGESFCRRRQIDWPWKRRELAAARPH